MVRTKPTPTDPKTDRQLWHRHLYLVLCQYWNGLSTAQKTQWESDARRHHITGFNYFLRTELNKLENIALYLPLDEGTGSIATDFSGNLHHGTIYGAQWTDGKFGKCLSFDGIDDRIEHGNILNLNYPFSLEVWLNSTNTAESYASFITKHQGGPTYHGYILRFQGATRKPHLQIITPTGWAIIIADNPLSDNTWYHLLGTYDGTFLRLYVNGAPAATPVAFTQNLTVWGPTLYIGASSQGHFFPGRLDEAFIHTRTLTPAEVLLRYNRKASP